jgi:hypothetical protein
VSWLFLARFVAWKVIAGMRQEFLQKLRELLAEQLHQHGGAKDQDDLE